VSIEAYLFPAVSLIGPTFVQGRIGLESARGFPLRCHDAASVARAHCVNDRSDLSVVEANLERTRSSTITRLRFNACFLVLFACDSQRSPAPSGCPNGGRCPDLPIAVMRCFALPSSVTSAASGGAGRPS